MAKRRHSVRRHKRVKTKNSSKRGRRLEERVAVPNNCLLIHNCKKLFYFNYFNYYLKTNSRDC